MSNIKLPNLKLYFPGDANFWRAVATQVQKQIRIRTEADGVDYRGNAFKPYKPKYAEYRAKKGRTTVPNLSFTGAMLGGVRAIGHRNSGEIKLTGEQAAKAWGNEQRGRVFFKPSREDYRAATKLLSRWMARKNRLR